MFSAIRSSHRPTTPIARVTAALPDLPHRHRKRQRRVGASSAIVRAVGTCVTAALPDRPQPQRQRRRRVGAAAIVRAGAGLLAVLIGTAASRLRDKLASIVSRGDGGRQAPDAAAK
jgi:hypothetical protein